MHYKFDCYRIVLKFSGKLLIYLNQIKKSMKHLLFTCCCAGLLSLSVSAQKIDSLGQKEARQYLSSMHRNITSDKLFQYVKHLSDPSFEGRLAGSPGMARAAKWAEGQFADWGLLPAGDNGGYIQEFPHPCVEVQEGSMNLMFPVGKDKKEWVSKSYPWADGWFAGGTSATGEVQAEVIYAGYGITAPELGYDDYKGIDVRGKIVLIEGETPNSSSNKDTLAMWYPYTLHQNKVQNAVKHGAAGMLYKWVPGPNNAYDPNFIYCYVTSDVVNDAFSGTGKNYRETIRGIRKTKKPDSFNTGKKATIKMVTKYTPNATGKNVVGYIKGSDPKLSEEYVIVSGHLDHLGMIPYHIAGANDNNSATAVLMGVAEALAKSPVKPKRSVLFINIDGEEAGLTGSTYYTKHPIVPKEKVVGILNLEQVGVGQSLYVTSGIEYPGIGRYFEQANDRYVHRNLGTGTSRHLTRPRTDGAVFMKAGYPCVDIGAGGEEESFYHHPKDDWNTITPEILQDCAKLLYWTTINLANDETPELSGNRK